MAVASVKKILLAEDDNSMRRFVEIILQKAGFEVFATEDGLAAMHIALENEIDAVVADAIMPNLSGYDLCRMLRANADKKHIPVIILSGLNQENPPSAPDLLADAYLIKNENLKTELTETLARFLPQRHGDTEIFKQKLTGMKEMKGIFK